MARKTQIRILLIAALALTAGGMPAPSIGTPNPAQGASSGPGLTCLLYHRFVTRQEYGRIRGDERYYSIPIETFDEQLQRLKQLGYRSITADEAVAFAKGQIRWSQPAVLITIDDGCQSAISRAEPLLRKYGFHAVLFVTVDPAACVFDPERAEQRRISDAALDAIDPRVIEVQSHGVTHRPLRDLSDRELMVELVHSREELERITGQPVHHLAIPGNWYDARVLRKAGEAGYEGVFVSDRDWIRPGCDPTRLPRFNVAGFTHRSTFDTILNGAVGKHSKPPDHH